MHNRYGDMQFVLRGIASIGIVLFHVAMAQRVTDAFTGTILTTVVHASLRVFFFLSGYTIYWYFASRSWQISPLSLMRFYIERVRRIAPLFVAACIVVYVTSRNEPLAFETYIHIVSFTISPTNVPIRYGYLWFVSTLMQWYILAPFVYMMLSVLHRMRPLVSVITIGIIIVTGIVVRVTGDTRQYDVLYSSIIYTVDACVLGMMTAQLLRRYQSIRFGDVMLALTIVVWSIATVLLIWFGTMRFPDYHSLRTAPFVLIYFPLLSITAAGLTMGSARLYNGHLFPVIWIKRLFGSICRPLAFIGQVSYPLYLFHVSVLDWVHRRCVSSCGATQVLWTSIVVLGLVLGGIVSVSRMRLLIRTLVAKR